MGLRTVFVHIRHHLRDLHNPRSLDCLKNGVERQVNKEPTSDRIGADRKQRALLVALAYWAQSECVMDVEL